MLQPELIIFRLSSSLHHWVAGVSSFMTLFHSRNDDNKKCAAQFQTFRAWDIWANEWGRESNPVSWRDGCYHIVIIGYGSYCIDIIEWNIAWCYQWFGFKCLLQDVTLCCRHLRHGVSVILRFARELQNWFSHIAILTYNFIVSKHNYKKLKTSSIWQLPVLFLNHNGPVWNTRYHLFRCVCMKASCM